MKNMRRYFLILAAGTVFAASGCLVGAGQAAHLGVAGPSGSPFIFSPAAGAPTNSDYGDSPSADDKSGDAGAAAKTALDPSAGNDSPVTVVAQPVGFTPSPSADDKSGDTGATAKTVPDPPAGNDLPITVVGQPGGFSSKNPECMGVQEVHICFGQVRVEVSGEKDSLLRFPYRVSGGIYAKIKGGDLKVIRPMNPIAVFDQLHPEQPVDRIYSESGDFFLLLNSSVGRPIRLEQKYCGRVTQLDFTTPNTAESPLIMDPCGSSGDTDFADSDVPVEGPPVVLPPPDLPAPPAAAPLLPSHPRTPPPETVDPLDMSRPKRWVR